MDRRLGLGIADEPRRVAVEARRTRVDRELVSTPGARVSIRRDGWNGEVERALLWCLRHGVPVEIVTGEPGVCLDGDPIDPEQLRKRMR
jgi:hypothetical protein